MGPFMVTWECGDLMRISMLHSYAAINNYQNASKACIIASEMGWFGRILGHGLELTTTFPKLFIGHIGIFVVIEPPNSSFITYIYIYTLRCLWQDIQRHTLRKVCCLLGPFIVYEGKWWPYSVSYIAFSQFENFFAKHPKIVNDFYLKKILGIFLARFRHLQIVSILNGSYLDI